MEIIRRIHSMKEITNQARSRGLKIGFVPTMGALHEGHLSLIRRIDEIADVVVASIFVNPTQFGPQEDLEKYPRSMTADADLCIAEGVDYLFTPDVDAIYPPGSRTYVEVEGLSERLEGASRSGHFRGVTTVVLKLFEIVRPHVAAFGQKDAQQALIVKRMVEDLMLDVEVHTFPIVRDADGIALSSRNRFLSEDELRAARAIPAALEAAKQAYQAGRGGAAELLAAAREPIEAERLLRVDYLELVETSTLEPAAEAGAGKMLVLAVHCGPVRLLDNMLFED